MNNSDLELRQEALIGHIIKMIDAGWVFVCDKPEPRAVFKAVMDEFEFIRGEPRRPLRVAALTGMAERLANAGWDPVQILYSSNNVKRVFREAREYVEEVSQNNAPGMSP
ncbi:hypothetical protein [Devosia sp.]|uniref:hypothetical protein n=1 Tax=Devosia sp. TaxID=1871048 RepID=UPI0027329BA6|nr:hypothetical protein [Devosia sp.]MDP2782258.1 hypothetical protein [Devosia sp.]